MIVMPLSQCDSLAVSTSILVYSIRSFALLKDDLIHVKSEPDVPLHSLVSVVDRWCDLDSESECEQRGTSMSGILCIVSCSLVGPLDRLVPGSLNCRVVLVFDDIVEIELGSTYLSSLHEVVNPTRNFASTFWCSAAV